jgi:hypothetical protein
MQTSVDTDKLAVDMHLISYRKLNLRQKNHPKYIVV